MDRPQTAPIALHVQNDRERAAADFRRMMKWIVLTAVAMVVAALAYLAFTGELTTHMVIATVIGVFLSVLLGSGLIAASYFSSKSGHDQSISDATGKRENED